MARRHRLAVELALLDHSLENRELLAQTGLPMLAPLVGTFQAAGQPGQATNLFHQNGIQGFKLHKTFVNTLNYRLNLSKDMAHLVFEAFQVFQQAYVNTPALLPGGAGGTPGNPPSTGGGGQGGNGSSGNNSGAPGQPLVPVGGVQLGNPPMPANLANLLADLQSHVVFALSNRENRTNETGPSALNGPFFSPSALQALVPYAQAQLQQMGSALATLPPPDGNPSSAAGQAATRVLSGAYNAIMNAIAEYSVHPTLFQKPSDFYISPDVFFTLNFDGTPAKSAPGFFVRGPGGVILPGATLHPHVPT